MKKIGMLFACVMLAACGGGSSSKGAREPAPEPVAMETAEADTTAADETLPTAQDTTFAAPKPAQPTGPTEPAETVDPMSDTEPMPAEPVAQAPTTATAELIAVKGGASLGTITFERNAEGAIMIYGTFTGLKKNGVHALYIHENGDCSKKGKAAGGHLNPTKAKHGPPASSQRHAGDFGNLTADEDGNASFSMTTDSVTMEGDRPDSVVNRAVIIHAKKDDKKGSGGAALACGVITLAAE
jgi:superoxide dismutase, Cu-Zn family